VVRPANRGYQALCIRIRADYLRSMIPRRSVNQPGTDGVDMVNLRQVNLLDLGRDSSQPVIKIANLGDGQRPAEAKNGSALRQLLLNEISRLRHADMIGAFLLA
jgi:hypothetical protein